MDILEFALKVGRLKKIKRSGWVREKVKDSETIAEHIFRTAVLAIVLAPKLNVNQEKLVKMALIHDLGESEVGDRVVERRRKIEQKKKRRKELWEERVVGDMLGTEYGKLFREMIERKTKEAKALWQIDKLETAISALEYETAQNIDSSEFIVNAEMHITHPYLKKILEEVKKRRKR